MPVLVAVDLVAIQRFVFQSNRLKDAVGGSQIAEWATSTEGLVGELAPGAALVGAGGNAILEFEGTDAADAAKRFTARYTRRLLQEAPGLEAAVAHRSYERGDLAKALLALQVDLGCAKTELRASAPLLGLGVTAVCRETGRPAVDVVQEDEAWIPVSGTVKAARDRRDEAKKRWARRFLEGLPLQDGVGRVEFPLELDDLGRTEHERSLLGVVHVDGNGIGATIGKWLRQHVEKGTDDELVRDEHREWSGELTRLGEHALTQVVRRVAAALRPGTDNDAVTVTGTVADLNFALKREDGTTWLPLRPILLGGDDLTFVCDGRLALDLAVTAAQALEGTLTHLGPVSACAGVAVVPVHAPFIRAYQLAEALCQQAKRAREREQWSGGAVDWHIGAVRPGTSVEALRERHYQGKGGVELTARPYPLNGQGGLSWSWLRDELLGQEDTGLRGRYWSERHAKAVQLGRLAGDGEDEVGRALERWRISEPKLKLPRLIEQASTTSAHPCSTRWSCSTGRSSWPSPPEVAGGDRAPHDHRRPALRRGVRAG
ncbi:MAG: Cas10/Cmr2 second palm domain-containing protein [Egibacteraceae bacterium]